MASIHMITCSMRRPGCHTWGSHGPELEDQDEYIGVQCPGTDGAWRYVVHRNENQAAAGNMNSDAALSGVLIYRIGREAYENLRSQI